MKIAYFDCIGGASGDMILGALLDAGLAKTELESQLAKLHLQGFAIDSQKVTKNGIGATKADVRVRDQATERRLPEILNVVQNSDLPEEVKQKSVEIFNKLGTVEAAIHGTSIEEVHLHELGGLDTIVDVVGALVGLRALQVDRVYASPLPLGRGFTHSAHGQLPLPAPATVALLQGIPVVGKDLEFELVTPTGAALLAHLAQRFGPIPAMHLTGVGYGAGGRDLPVPNVLRVLLGEENTLDSATLETLVMLETNIDDLNPEIYHHVMAQLFAAGALDVTLAPLHMKKNRPGTQLAVLCRPGDESKVAGIVFSETSTLGVRKQFIERWSLERQIKTLKTEYGPVRAKIAKWAEGQVKITPEYEDCRKLADERNLPLREIYRAADFAARAFNLQLDSSDEGDPDS